LRWRLRNEHWHSLKIRADEHVASALVDAIRSIGMTDASWEITAVKQVGDQGLSDVHWITKFADEGGTAILSADTDFLRNPPQVMAVFNTGVKVIHLPAKWQNAEGRLQAAHILLWWKRIEAILVTMKPRECYSPPWNLQETGELKKVDIDFHTARRKLKKSGRRTPR
jgi:hypothetical protein